MTPRVYQKLRELQQSRTVPFCGYVYDLGSLRSHIQAMRSVLPEGCELFYAAKANPDEHILNTLDRWVDGFEAASGGELAWLKQHVPGRSLIFGGPGKLTSELELAVRHEIDAIHVESLTELNRLEALAQQTQQRVSILLRMNIPLPGIEGTRLMMGGKPTPFGLDVDELPQALRIVKASSWLQLKGFHFHLMSHQLDVERHLALMQCYLR
ncbi:alanine racemase [Pectobacteriaceae bacterium C52]|nr:alanine racemase [Pectobacteriaceae bacterium C52]